MELSVFEHLASPAARPNETAVVATRADDGDSQFDSLVRAATQAAERSQHDDRPRPDQSQSNHQEAVAEPTETAEPVAADTTSEDQPTPPTENSVAEEGNAAAPASDESDSTDVAVATVAAGEEPSPVNPQSSCAIVVPSGSVLLPDAAVAHAHAATDLPAKPLAPPTPDIPEQALTALAAANPVATPAPVAAAQPVHANAPTAPQANPAAAPSAMVLPDSSATPSATPTPNATPATVTPAHQPIVAAVSTPLPAAATVAPTAPTAPPSPAAGGAQPEAPETAHNRLPAAAAATAELVRSAHQAGAPSTDSADDGGEEIRPDLPQNAAAAALAARAKSAQSNRPAWARAGSRPVGASPSATPPGAAQSTTSQPTAAFCASPVRDIAITIAPDHHAPGQAVRLDGGAPDLAAFRETLSTVLPETASGAALEGIRTTGRALGAELAARAQHHIPTVPEQISIRIRQAATAGESEIRLQLQPKELGRIDVRIDVSEGGRVSAHVVADRADTLELLLRDQRGLERALQQAGFDTDSDSLEFSLRDPDDEGFETADDGSDGPETEAEDFVETALDIPTTGIIGDPTRDGVDIRV